MLRAAHGSGTASRPDLRPLRRGLPGRRGSRRLPAAGYRRRAGDERRRASDLDGRHGGARGSSMRGVHLVWSGGTDPVGLVDREGEQLTLLRAAGHARDQLRAGITTVRDLGSNWDAAIHVARAVDRGAIEGPDGRRVRSHGDHDRRPRPVLGPGLRRRATRSCAAYGTQVASGAGVIETAATGGVYGQASRGRRSGERADLRRGADALTSEAHRRGRKVAVHALAARGSRTRWPPGSTRSSTASS